MEKNLIQEMGERLRKYIVNMTLTLEVAKKNFTGDKRAREVLDEVERYYQDAKYYYDKGDYVTGLVAISYAEGLLDALKALGYTYFDWRRLIEEKKVFVGGTFDIIHPGHIYLLREASKLGKVYVVVSRDINATRYKGREPVNPENWRLEIISSIRYVYKSYLGDPEDPLKMVETIKPDIILLGPDQIFREEDLKRELRQRGLESVEIIRLPERLPNYSSLGVIRKILDRYCIKQDQCTNTHK
ncbi:MAG: DUF357 domain-containing protein [Sulfolobales archaeon]